jgi:hypothetical protein
MGESVDPGVAPELVPGVPVSGRRTGDHGTEAQADQSAAAFSVLPARDCMAGFAALI